MKRFAVGFSITFAAILLALSAGCATVSTPEAQIAAGANSVAATTTLATVALRNDKITVAQAKTFNATMHAAGAALDNAGTALTKCRAATNSTAATVPDPCQASTVAIIQTALDDVAAVKRQLDTVK